MRKKAIEKQQREIIRVTKDDKLQIRLNKTLKQRYEKALMLEGLSMTDHITNKIIEFCVCAEDAAKKKALKK